MAICPPAQQPSPVSVPCVADRERSPCPLRAERAGGSDKIWQTPIRLPDALVSSKPLAIEGGPPALAEEKPVWPIPDDEVRAAIQSALEDGSWGRYDGPHLPALGNQVE